MNGANLPRPPVYRITLSQLLCLVLSWWLVRYTGYPVIADSLLYGGLIAALPQAWFAWRVFQFRGARSAAQIAQASYAGEIAKFVLTVSGFAAVFALVRPLEGWAVFAGYGEMLVIQIVGSWWLLKLPTPVDGTES